MQMRRNNFFGPGLIALSVVAFTSSCRGTSLSGSSGSTGTSSLPAAAESTTPSSAAASGTAANSGPAQPLLSADTALLDATYNVTAWTIPTSGTATAANSTQVCKGNLAIKVNGSLGSDGQPLFQVPSGSIDCAIVGSINLQQILGALANQTGTISTGFAVDGDVLSVTNLGPGTYSPPRPIVPSFLASSKTALQTLNLTRPIVLTTSTLVDSGTVQMQMLSFDQPYTPPQLGFPLSHVADFTVVNTGFAKVDQVANMIFDRMELHVSTDPVAVVSLSIQGKLTTVLQAAESANASGTTNTFATGVENYFASWFDVSLELELVSQVGLTVTTAAGTTSGAIGETVGGTATGD